MLVRYRPRTLFQLIALAVWLLGLIVYGFVKEHVILLFLLASILLPTCLGAFAWLDKRIQPKEYTPGLQWQDVVGWLLLMAALTAAWLTLRAVAPLFI